MDSIPRRSRLDLSTPAELAIRAAVDEVEKAGCHLLLTDAVVLLGQAREKVADFVDGVERQSPPPINMVLHCPNCGQQHVDAPEPGTDWDNPPHKSHLCRTQDGGCGTVWRPADVATNGVERINTRGDLDTWPLL